VRFTETTSQQNRKGKERLAQVVVKRGLQADPVGREDLCWLAVAVEV